jgi:MFS family permease
VPARVRLAAGSLFLLPFLLLLPSPTEAFYWATSALAYTLATACCLVLLGAVARLATEEKPGLRAVWWAVAVLAAVLAPGFSEIIGCFVLALALVLAPAVWQRRLTGGRLALLLLAVGAAAVATLAPGNFVRQAAALPRHLSPARSVLVAVAALAYSLYGWLSSGFLILLTLLVLPVLQQLAGLAQLPLVRLTKRVWVWPLGLLLGLLLCYVFSYVAVGGPPPSRTRNVLLAFFLVGWFLSWVGVLAHRQRRGLASLPVLPAYGRAGLLGLLGLLIGSDHNRQLKREAVGTPTNSVAQAYRDWLSGDAARYDREEEARYQLIRSTPAAAVAIPPLSVRPETLFWWDISANSTLWGNRAYAAFFNKQDIWTAPAAGPPEKPNNP